MTVEKFRSNVRTVFEKVVFKNDCFLVILGLHLAIFVKSESYDFDDFAHMGP